MPMPTFSAGNRLTAAQVELMARQIDSLTAPGWTDYSGTFTLTGSVTDPTKGNSVYVAHHRRPAASDLIHVRIHITIGSTFVAGSGDYRFLLPVAASVNAVGGTTDNCYILDTGTAIRQAVVTLFDATHVQIYLNGAVTAIGSAGSGTAWAAGDEIKISMSYEPA